MLALSHRNSCRGFTLVELLVVLGIISILAAILFPALNVAMTQARKAKCTSNLRTISAAMITYAGDNNGDFPVSGGTVYHTGSSSSPVIDPNTLKASWTEQLETYLGPSTVNGTTTAINPIFQCPEWMKASNLSGAALPATANPSKYYSYFNGAHAAGGGQTDYAPLKLMRIQAPSAHIIAGDIACNTFQMLDADPDDYGPNNPAFKGTKILIHGGSVNIAFADGHLENVRSYDPSRMTTHYSGIQPTALYTDYP